MAETVTKPVTSSPKGNQSKTATKIVAKAEPEKDPLKQIGVSVQIQIPDGPAISASDNISVEDVFSTKATLTPGTKTSLSVPSGKKLCFVLVKANGYEKAGLSFKAGSNGETIPLSSVEMLGPDTVSQLGKNIAEIIVEKSDSESNDSIVEIVLGYRGK